MSYIIFLTGASGAGKTSLLTALSKQLTDKNLTYLKFDSIGVPSEEEMIKDYGSGSEWQRAMLYQWIASIKQNYTDKKLVILDGQVNLTFIKAGCEHYNSANYSIVLIHCMKETRHARLAKYRQQPELINNNMDNWANILYQQAIDCQATILDTSYLTLEEAVAKFNDYLLRLKY